MSGIRTTTVAVAVTGALALQACGGGGGGSDKFNQRPSFLGTISTMQYDGNSDDLLTGGLGLSGLMAAAPAYAVPASPTPAELRRNAIHTNYRAVLDYTAAGGFGSLYGPNIDANGNDTLGQGKIAGTEYIALADDGSGRKNVTLMVQVPASFNKAAACIVTGTSSGSRGVYGAIGSAGEWGLKRGCAVAYADKGTGNGLHDLMTDKVNITDGSFVTAANAGANALFRANLSAVELAAFNAAFPNRVAYKHAHSQQNPEKDWGVDTLNAVRFAFYVLNEQFVTADPTSGLKLREIKPSNTIVIASSISNGGGAALAAAEQDTEGLIDGVAVSEPNAQPRDNAALAIRQGAATVATHSKPLVDYFTYANIYQPCAALSAGLSLNAAFWPAAYTTSAGNRCAALAARGLLSATTLTAQADEALAKLHAYGWGVEQDFLQQSHYRFATNAIVMTYVNTYGRFSVADNVCGFSFAATDATGSVAVQNATLQAGIFASGNGVPPTTGVNVVYNDSVGGAKLDFLGVSATSGTADFSLDGALCMRALVTGKDEATGVALTGDMKARADRVQAGIQEVLLSGNLRGKPTIIVSGRSDALVPVNHAGRAYFGKNRLTEGTASRASYVEVTNAQHFDTFLAFGALLGYDTRFVPLHHYFGQAMDMMYAHLGSGAPLPSSQVVRTTPRATGAALTLANLPPILPQPAVADSIQMSGTTLVVPD
jgi:hydroxybutyrate-dimer hydrolase